MSIVTLLHWPDDARGQAAFSFDHAHEHENLAAAMTSPSPFNLIRYLLDPTPTDAMNGASPWDMNHQQSHDDAAQWFKVQPSLQVIDSSTQSNGPFQWFLFVNSQEHSALNLAVLQGG